jgi:hypothetical protein
MADWNYAEWAEKAGTENLKNRMDSGDVLLTQANTLLSILLVGIGGGMSYALKLAETGGGSVQLWGAAGATAWLSWVAAVLVFKCIATRETEVLGASPASVYKPDLCLTEVQVRGYFMDLVQDRIAFTIERNKAVAYWLDRCRFAVIATPVVFTLAALVAGR